MIIFLFGRSGSGKSAIAQATIQMLGMGEELSGEMVRKISGNMNFSPEGREQNCCDLGQYIFNKKYKNFATPIFVTLEAPTEACRVAFLNKMQLMNVKIYRVFINASFNTCVNRAPKELCRESKAKYLNYASYEIPEHDDIDLILDTENASVEKHAGFLANCIMARL